MTMTTEPEAAEPAAQYTGQEACCPRCGTIVEITMMVREGVTVLDVIPHDCQPTEVLPATRPPEHTQASVGVRTAIDAATEAALANPGMPGRDEFLNLAAQARMLHMSGGAPELIRKDVYLAFHVVLVGRDLGISPSAAMALIDVIPSSNGPQLSLSPQLLNGQIRRLGLGSIRPAKRDEYAAVAVAYGPDGEVLGESEFTWQDAQMAGLVGKDCQPGDHKGTKAGRGQDGCGCNQGYRTYPKRMMWWRAAGFAADDFFPEAGLGLYSPEELGAVIDGEGRPIDVSNVELPPGYQPEPPPPPEPVDYTLALNLQVAILALPDQQKAELRDRWQNSDKLKGKGAWRLDAGEIRLATSLVKGFEAAARRDSKGEWNQDTAQMATMATLSGVVGALLAYPIGLPSGSADTGPGPTEPPATDPAPQPPAEDAQEPTEIPDPAAAFKEQLAGATDAQVDEAIEAVKALKADGVDKELTRLRQNCEGHINDRRRRLGLALLFEALHGGPPAEQIP